MKKQIPKFLSLFAMTMVLWQQGFHFLAGSHEALSPCESVTEKHFHESHEKDCQSCSLFNSCFLATENFSFNNDYPFPIEKENIIDEIINLSGKIIFSDRGPPGNFL